MSDPRFTIKLAEEQPPDDIAKLEETIRILFRDYINRDDEHAWALLTERHPHLVKGTAEEDTRELT